MSPSTTNLGLETKGTLMNLRRLAATVLTVAIATISLSASPAHAGKDTGWYGGARVSTR